MKKTTLILLTFIILMGTYSCKKDYPKDIPDWLIDKIKELKKENPCNPLPISIEEYKNSDTIIYIFTKPCPSCSDDIYDCNGNLICRCTMMLTGCTCNGINLINYSLERCIWTETCEK